MGTVVNLLNQSAPTKSVDQNSANLINMYLTEDQDQGKYQQAAYPTPGTTIFATINTPVRAEFEEHGVLYAIGGNTFYSISSAGVTVVLGTLNTSTGFAKIRGINQELLIIDKTNGYVYNIITNTFAVISSTTYVSQIVMTAPGTNYANPTVNIIDSTGTGATATTTVVGGQVTGVTLTANGSGYTSPTVSFTDATGTGATATAYTTTTSFNNNVIDCECQDEFGIVAYPASQEWAVSDISDLTTWPGLSVASTTGSQTNLVGMISLHREIWLFGEKTTEIWYNAGNLLFTFARRNDIFIQYGCAASASIARGDDTIFLLAQSDTGGIVAVRMNGYTPQIISTRAINYQFSTYAVYNDAIGFVYQQEGHEFYVLIFPTQGVTWAYDVSTQMWHQRSSLISGVQSRWLPSCYSYCYGKQLIGDSQSGNIYALDMTNFTENGAAITRMLVTHPFYQAGAQLYCDNLQIDFDQTPGAGLSVVNLYISRDGGNTFGAAKPAVPVQTSDGQWRVYWPRLGKARNWVFKIVTTINNKFIILGAWMNVRSGAN